MVEVHNGVLLQSEQSGYKFSFYIPGSCSYKDVFEAFNEIGTKLQEMNVQAMEAQKALDEAKEEEKQPESEDKKDS